MKTRQVAPPDAFLAYVSESLGAEYKAVGSAIVRKEESSDTAAKNNVIRRFAKQYAIPRKRAYALLSAVHYDYAKAFDALAAQAKSEVSK